VLQVVMNGLNIGLDLLFVLQLGWGVDGVAIATFIAEWSGLALGLWFCRGAFATPAWRDRARVLDPARLRHFAQVNTDILIRSLLLQGILVSFLLLGARFGDVPLAANQILVQFMTITAFALDGFAFAAETLVGQAMGARRRAALRRAASLCSGWALVSGALLAGAFATLGGTIIDVMTTADPVREVARVYLPYMVLAPVLGVAPFMLDGIFIGATRTRDMRNMMALSVAIYALAALVLIPAFGNHGLWMAMLTSFVARALTLGLRYRGLEAAAEA